jgi:hypothetical protein
VSEPTSEVLAALAAGTTGGEVRRRAVPLDMPFLDDFRLVHSAVEPKNVAGLQVVDELYVFERRGRLDSWRRRLRRAARWRRR